MGLGVAVGTGVAVNMASGGIASATCTAASSEAQAVSKNIINRDKINPIRLYLMKLPPFIPHYCTPRFNVVQGGKAWGVL